MSKKILIADDSLTIQKVVGITLAKTDFELVQALNDSELFSALSSESYALVLLDFNLCDEMNGYDLAKKIKTIQPNINILVMLGTFDSIDEDKLLESGISDKVVKPFESAKFISLCDSLANENPSSDDIEESNVEFEDESTDSFEMPESKKLNDFIADDNKDSSNDNVLFDEDESLGDDWVLNSSDDQVLDEEIIEDEILNDSSRNSSSSNNQLLNEMEGWGMSVPNVIGESLEKTGAKLPPAMGSSEEQLVETNSSVVEGGERENDSDLMVMDDEILEDDISIPEKINDGSQVFDDELSFSLESDEGNEEETLPSSEDLAYPIIDEGENNGSTSKLMPLSELESNEDEIDLESSDENISLQLISRKSDDDPDLKKVIDEDLTPDDFWATDGDEEVVAEESLETREENPEESDEFDLNEVVGIKTEENLKPISVNLEMSSQTSEEISDRKVTKKTEVNEEHIQSNTIKEDDLVERIMSLLEPKMEELIKKYASSSLDKVAWEIMPDLAENLIKEELKKVTSSLES